MKGVVHSQGKGLGVVPSPPPAHPSLQGVRRPSFTSLLPFFHARLFFNALFQRRKLWKYNDLRRFFAFFVYFTLS